MLCHVLKRIIGQEFIVVPFDLKLVFLIYSYRGRCLVRYDNIRYRENERLLECLMMILPNDLHINKASVLDILELKYLWLTL